MGTASGFSILRGSVDFRHPIEVLMCFIPNLLRDSTNLQKGFTTESTVLQFSFFWVSSPPRNAAKLIPRFSENVLQQHKLAIQIKFIE
jgi:hypothetical protein